MDVFRPLPPQGVADELDNLAVNPKHIAMSQFSRGEIGPRAQLASPLRKLNSEAEHIRIEPTSFLPTELRSYFFALGPKTIR